MDRDTVKYIHMIPGDPQVCYEFEDGTFFRSVWEMCIVSGCPNRRACQFPSSLMCDPHSRAKNEMISLVVDNVVAGIETNVEV